MAETTVVIRKDDSNASIRIWEKLHPRFAAVEVEDYAGPLEARLAAPDGPGLGASMTKNSSPSHFGIHTTTTKSTIAN